MPEGTVAQTDKSQTDASEIVKGADSNGREAPKVDEQMQTPKAVPTIDQRKSTDSGEEPEKAPGGSLEAFREYVMPCHPLRKMVELGFLLYQVSEGAYRGKRPDQVSRRPNEITDEAIDYVYWFIRSDFPTDIQILAFDFLDHGPLPDELNLEHTHFTQSICQLMLDTKARQAMELLIALDWDDFKIAKGINELDRGFRLDENEVATYRHLLWNISDLQEYSLAGYIGELSQQVRQAQVVQSPVEGPIPWARFSLGLDAQPLETYNSFVRYISGYSEILSELINLGLKKLDKGTLTRQLRAMIHAGFDSIDLCLQRGKREAAFKYLKPLKEMAEIANKFDIDVLEKSYNY